MLFFRAFKAIREVVPVDNSRVTNRQPVCLSARGPGWRAFWVIAAACLFSLGLPAAEAGDMNVMSTPILGVPVSGDRPGSTNYSAVCEDNTTVRISAPLVVSYGISGDFAFVRWILDGVNQPVGDTSLEIKISDLHVAEAVYEKILSPDEAEAPSDAADGREPASDDPTAPSAVSDLIASLADPREARILAQNATSSGSLSNSNVALKVTDGNTTTFWSSPASDTARPEHLTVDFGAPCTVRRVGLLPRMGFQELFPSSFSLETSIDGDAWTTLAVVAGYTARSGEWFERTVAPTAARYIRLSVTQSMRYTGNDKHQYYVQIAEFAAYYGVQRATSSGYYSVNVASNTVDRDTATFWSTAPTKILRTEWLAVDLGAPWTIGKVRLLPRAGFPDLFPCDFSLGASLDGLTWTPFALVDGYAPRSNQWFESSFSPITARHIRLSVPQGMMYAGDGKGNYYVQISEFEACQPQDPVHVQNVFGSGAYAANAARNATDGDTTTFWSSPQSPSPRTASLMLDFGAPRTIDKLRLLPRASFHDLFPSAFRLETSPDATAWTALVDMNGYLARSGEWFESTFPARTTRYVRLSVPQSMKYAGDGKGKYYIQIAEFQAIQLTDKAVQLAWSAPSSGIVAYDVRRGTQTIDSEAAWVSATEIDGEPVPAAVGTQQTMRLSIPSFPADYRYYFALKSLNGQGQPSDRSNVVSVLAPPVCPGDISDLAADWPVPVGVSAATDAPTAPPPYPVSNLIDGDENTFWRTAGTIAPQHDVTITLDLGVLRNIARIRLLPRQQYPELFPSSFAILTSADGQAWSRVISESTYVARTGMWYEKGISSRTARYVRMLISATKLYHPSAIYYAQIAEFQVCDSNVVRLAWTAPGSDGDTGIAASYDVRHATQGIVADVAWNNAAQVQGEPRPEQPGTAETMSLPTEDLPEGTTYFAIRATDDAKNVSGISNSPSANIDTTAPGDTELSAVITTILPGRVSVSGAASGSYMKGQPPGYVMDGDAVTFWSSPVASTP